MPQDNDQALGAKAVRAGLGYTVGNVLTKGIAFLTIPIFARLMSTAQYGVYNIYASYVSVFAVIVSLGLPSSVRSARYDLRDRERQYYSACAAMICLCLSCFLIGAWALRGPLEGWTKLSGWLLLIAVVNSGCTALHSYYNNILMISFRFKTFLKLSLFYSLLSVLCSLALMLSVFREESALGRALGNMLPMAAIGAYVLIKLWRGQRPRLSGPLALYGLRFGIPLIFNDLSSILLSQFDRMMIFSSVGESQAGIYSFAYNVAIIYQTVAASAEGAWTPWMFQQLHEDRLPLLRRRMRDYAAVLTICTVLLMLGSPELIRLLSGGSEAYSGSKLLVMPLIGGMYFFALGAAPVGIELYHKRTRWISLCTIGATALNILLNLWCIPRYGYQAAAYTTLACYFCYAAAHCLMAHRLLGSRIMFQPAILVPGLIMLPLPAALTLLQDMPLLRWGAILAISAAAAAYAVKRRAELGELIGSIIKR